MIELSPNDSMNGSDNVNNGDVCSDLIEPIKEKCENDDIVMTQETTDIQKSSAGDQNSCNSLSNIQEPAPWIEVKLFIGRVPKSMEENDIRPIFEEFGPVNEVLIIRDRPTGHHRGAAFVKMQSIAHADASIRALNGIKVLDNESGPMRVQYATGEVERLGFGPDSSPAGIDKAKLFVGGLPRDVSDQVIKDIFSPYGVIDEIFIMRDNVTGVGKGCAFIKYAYKEQAIYAIQNVHGLITMPDCTRPLEVRFASKNSSNANTIVRGPIGTVIHPQTTVGPMGYTISTVPAYDTGALYGRRPGAAANLIPRGTGPWKEYFTADGRPYYHNEMTNITQWERPPEFGLVVSDPGIVGSIGGIMGSNEISGPPGANVFIFNVPYEWTQNDLIHHFSHFGNIISAHMMTDRPTGRNKGVAFVSFDDVHSAANAVANMNGFLTEQGRRLKVSIKKGQEQYVQHLTTPQTRGSGAVIMSSGQNISHGNRYAPY